MLPIFAMEGHPWQAVPLHGFDSRTPVPQLVKVFPKGGLQLLSDLFTFKHCHLVG